MRQPGRLPEPGDGLKGYRELLPRPAAAVEGTTANEPRLDLAITADHLLAHGGPHRNPPAAAGTSWRLLAAEAPSSAASTAVSGVAMSSSDRWAASTPRTSSTRPAAIMRPAPR